MGRRVVFGLSALVLALSVFACGAPAAADSMLPQAVAGVAGTRAPKATKTPEATSTIGWAATLTAANKQLESARADALQAGQVANNAWSTAVAANVDAGSMTQAAVRVTAESEQRAYTLTQQASALRQAELEGTQTAAPTSIPATQTARVEDNKRTDALIAVANGALTSTAEAPTRVVQMAQAQAQAKYADAQAAANAFGVFAASLLGILLVILGAIMARHYYVSTRLMEEAAFQPVEQKPEPARPPIFRGTPVVVYGADTSYPSAMQTLAPATEEQLTELADRLLNKRVSLSINNFEGFGSTWNRKAISKMRGFLLDNGYASARGGGAPELTPQGVDFLRGWLNDHCLPTDIKLMPSHSNLPEAMSHERSYSWKKDGGEVVADGFEPLPGDVG